MKAIQTRYKGYHFRSRLEARWAVFFDALGYRWEYEPEGYKFPDGAHYLPDFKISGVDSNGDSFLFFFEVKPEGYKFSNEENQRFFDMFVALIAGKHQGDFICLTGVPEVRDYPGSTDSWVLLGPRMRPFFTNSETLEDWAWYLPSEIDYLAEAVAAARSARFEFGESGAS